MRVTGKEGSQHEEEYLIDALKQIIPTAKYQGNLLVPIGYKYLKMDDYWLLICL